MRLHSLKFQGITHFNGPSDALLVKLYDLAYDAAPPNPHRPRPGTIGALNLITKEGIVLDGADYDAFKRETKIDVHDNHIGQRAYTYDGPDAYVADAESSPWPTPFWTEIKAYADAHPDRDAAD